MLIKQSSLLVILLITTVTYSMTPDQGLLRGANWDDRLLVQAVLNDGANVNAKDQFGNTALKIACDGNIDLVSLLINNSAEINVRDEEGSTPLMWAAHQGHREIIQLLIDNHADVNIQDNDGRTALAWALINNKHDHIVALLIDNGAHTDTAFIEAASRCVMRVVKTLIEYNADLNATDCNGDTAIIFSSIGWHSQELPVLLASAGACLTGLEHYRRDLERAQAIRKEVSELFAALVDRNIIEVLGHKNTAEGFSKLLKAKPYLVYARNDKFDTLLHLLAASEADPKDRYQLYRFRIMMVLLSEYPKIIGMKDKSGYTPFDLALSNGTDNFVKVFIRAALNKSTKKQCVEASGTIELARLLDSQNAHEMGNKKANLHSVIVQK